VLVSGVASWYCKAGRSVCHYAFPDRRGPDLYAAACKPLRRALGADWRGQRVTVRRNGKSVRVKLVDWCGHPTRVIDLYWDAAARLGITGTGRVRIYVD